MAHAAAVLIALTATLRDVHEQLVGLEGETAALMRHGVERALTHAPVAELEQLDQTEGDFEPGTSIGDDDTARKVRELEGEPPAAAPSPDEILAENARLQARLAELEAERGNG